MTEEQAFRESQDDAKPSIRAAPRPSRCRGYARAKVAQAMPELVGTLIDRSVEGSLGHMRLLLLLSGLDEPTSKPKPGKTRDVAKELARKWRARIGMADLLEDE